MDDQLRQARPEDHPAITEAIRTWWSDSRSPEEARELAMMVPRVFLEHFARTSMVLEEDGRLIGFLIGFHSQDHEDESYIHFVGIDPAYRGRGLAQRLYTKFFDMAHAAGRTTVRAVTSPKNTNSIAFHRKLGFTVRPPSEGDIEALARMSRTVD